MTVWCLIPARGGSRGLPGKNLARVGGLSLVGRAVYAARCFAIDAAPTTVRIMVDTDDPAIADEGRAFGAEVPFLRDAALAGDRTGTVETVLGFFDRLGEGTDEDAVILLQPTSPLRTADDIAAVWHAASRPGIESAAAVIPTAQPLDLALDRHADGTLTWRDGDASDGRRRQDITPTMHLSGAVYSTRLGALRRTRQFVVSGATIGVPLDPHRSVDIDTADDLALAAALARAATPPPMVLAGRALHAGHPVFIIAEAGVNHDGDVKIAHALIDAAADAGADAVKFQTFDPALLVSADAPAAAYQREATGQQEQRAMLDALTLPTGAWAALAAHARRRKIIFLSTPFDTASADLLDQIGVDAFKVPSGELTNLPFIRDLARRGKPMLVSTGMSTMAEVAEALLAIRAAGNPPVMLFHCVSAYPAPVVDCNLAVIPALASAFNIPTGWSDHTPDATACLAAAALGAVILEKHLTLDCTRSGPDHAASLEPHHFAMLVSQVHTVRAAIGDGLKRPMPSEADVRRVARRSLHTARDLPAGAILTSQDLVVLRPGTGLPPATLDRLIGRRLAASLSAGTLLAEAHLG